VKAILYILGLCGAVFAGVWIATDADVQQPAGILAAAEPQQVDILERVWDHGNYRFTALAAFGATARILSTNHYWYDAASEISPVDLALGWGPMSDSAIINHLHISQGSRFYHWRALYREPLPLQKSEIISHSANMHMIPATEDIRKSLLEARKGELVRISGYLVLVEKANGWKWRTSLSRTDSGPGSCEVVWVDWIKRTSTVAY
jgi:hypothetical protein